MWVARRRSSARRICSATGWLSRTRRLRHLLAWRGVLRPRSAWRRSSGAPSSSALRVLTAAVRAVQSGFVRYYAALLVLGLAGVGFYFLLQS